MPEMDLAGIIASDWDQIASALGEKRRLIEPRLTSLLRQLEVASEGERAALTRRILDLFHEFGPAYERLMQAVHRAAGNRGKGAGVPAGAVAKQRYVIVPVLYGTDRSPIVDAAGGAGYSAERGALAMGVAEVSIPDDHRMGRIEQPALWRLEFREDPAKHVVVLRVSPLAPEAFEVHGRALVADGHKAVLLFVHGYNVGFRDAASRAAQIAYDLHFEGVATLYSWPSEDAAVKYTVDENNVNWSRPHFAQFLATLRSRLGAETIHIVAHSMGNRLLTEALAALATPITGEAHLRQVVFAAPDVDAATFKEASHALGGKAERFTLYASSRDKALAASKAVHKYSRAGDAGVDIVVVDTVDTIDATSVDTSLLGHCYYGDNRSVLSDLFYVIRESVIPPGKRAGLKEAKKYGGRYWRFA